MSSKEIKKNKEENNEADDVVFESEENQEGEDIIKKLRKKLKQVSSEKQEYLEGWQRTKADFINVKKDFNEEKTQLLKFAKADLITQLIPVLDSLEMAFEEKKEDKTASQKEWMVGMQHIYSQFLSILKENGVEQLNSLKEKFDPTLHTSIEIIKIDDKEKDGIITEVIRKGYSLNGEIIRTSKVKVGEFKKKM